MGRIARFGCRNRTGSRQPDRAAGARGAVHLSGRCWCAPLLVRAGAAFHEGPAGKITAPVLVVHGEDDRVVPLTLGKRLYDLVRSPKRFVSIVRAGHNNLGARAVVAAKQFISKG